MAEASNLRFGQTDVQLRYQLLAKFQDRTVNDAFGRGYCFRDSDNIKASHAG